VRRRVRARPSQINELRPESSQHFSNHRTPNGHETGTRRVQAEATDDMRNQVSDITSALKALTSDAFITLRPRLERGGALQGRRLASGAVQLYWRFTHDGRRYREAIGVYDASAPPKKLQPTARGYGIAAALEKCRELAVLHADHAAAGGLRGLKAEQQRAVKAQQENLAEQSRRTLSKLLDTYVAYLKAVGRRSHVDARQIFDRHAIEPWPRVANAPAANLTPDQVLDMLRRLIEAGKGRTANKLRSYLRAAFQCGLDVRVDASIPMAFKAFAVSANPVALTRRSPQFDRADKRPFSVAELRTYWHLIAERPGREAAALRLHLLTGGQRIEQFVRLRWADVGESALTLFDGKGRPGQGPRAHQIPLLPQARADLGSFKRAGEFAISTTAGKKAISVRTLAGWAQDLVGDAIEGFQLKRIRSGVETLLAAQGVSREIRGHLQSHGLTGVQARHYDGHDYMPEKSMALETLVRAIRGAATAPDARAEELQRRRVAFGTRRKGVGQRNPLVRRREIVLA
jgi:integrase